MRAGPTVFTSRSPYGDPSAQASCVPTSLRPPAGGSASGPASDVAQHRRTGTTRYDRRPRVGGAPHVLVIAAAALRQSLWRSVIVLATTLLTLLICIKKGEPTRWR